MTQGVRGECGPNRGYVNDFATGYDVGGYNYLFAEWRVEYVASVGDVNFIGHTFCERWKHDPFSGYAYEGSRDTYTDFEARTTYCPEGYGASTDPPIRQDDNPTNSNTPNTGDPYTCLKQGINCQLLIQSSLPSGLYSAEQLRGDPVYGSPETVVTAPIRGL
jgi:hypothetical protein